MKSSDLKQQAVERWNELLAEEEGLEARVPELAASFVDRGLELDGRPLCGVLRPHFVTEDQLAHQTALSEHVISAIRKVREALTGVPELNMKHLEAFHGWIGHLLELEGETAGEGTLLRLDASIARTELHFIELNADMPHGTGHNDGIAEFFQGLDTYERFAREFSIRPLLLQQRQLDALLGTWQEWGGTSEPTIGLLTWSDDPVRMTNVHLDRDFYASRRVDALVADPRELTFDGGRLRASGREIDLVVRILLTGECVARSDELEPLLEAVRERAVCMVNPFRSELLGHKAVFALLTDPERDFGLTAAEREAVRRHVPWTRQVFDGRTTDHAGAEVDLAEHAVAHRHELVLKPTHDFGGHGVTLGWRENEAGWSRALETALESDFIVQRRVTLQREGYPSMGADLASRDYYEDTDPFLFRGVLGGYLTRLSGSEITNVHADGSVVATFAIGPGA